MAFAILAEAVAQILADPRKLRAPPELAWAFAEYLFPALPSKLWGRSCKRAGVQLAQAHKFVFDQDFSRLVVDFAEQSPETIERVFATARPPFEHCWIEWDRKYSPDFKSPEDYDHQIGMLLVPGDVKGEHDVMVVIGPPGEGEPLIVPGVLQCSFHHPLKGVGSDVEALFGFDYYQRWPRQRDRMAMSRLHKYGTYALGGPPYGDALTEVAAQLIQLGKGPGLEILQICASCVPGVFRELICGLALVATHIGGTPIVKQTVSRTQKRYYAGKFHPAVEYKILQLVRPVTTPRVLRRAFPRTTPQPARWHQVMGAWHHRCAPAAACAIHPRACPVAQWQPVVEDDGQPGGDLQACTVCRRHRWFVRDHARGDPDLGMVDKGYEIVASERRLRLKAQNQPQA